jgi:hypothetical protein
MCSRSAILIPYDILYIVPYTFYVLMLKEAAIFISNVLETRLSLSYAV